MKKLFSLLTIAIALSANLSTSSAASAQVISCSVSVSYAFNETPRFIYARDFDVSLETAYDEDLSSRFRFGAFNASVAFENSAPVVSIFFDRDVSAFNEVSFTTRLKIRDRVETTFGGNEFRTSAPGSAGAHKTDYKLTCKKR